MRGKDDPLKQSQHTEHCSQRGQPKQTARGIDNPKGLSPFSPSRYEDTKEKNESSKSKDEAIDASKDEAIDASKDGEYTDYYSYYSESEGQGTATSVAAATATGTATAVRNQASNAAAAGSTSHSQSATSHSRSVTDTAGAKDPNVVLSSSDTTDSSSSSFTRDG